MEIELTFKGSPGKIIERINEGLIEENNYYNCTLDSDFSNEKELLKIISNSKWDDPYSNPVDKNIKRFLNHLTDFKPQCTMESGAVVCYIRVDIDRIKETTTQLDSSHKIINVSLSDLKNKMSIEEYKDFISSPIGFERKTEKKYPVQIVKVEDLKYPPKCKECNGTGKIECPTCHGIGDGQCPDCQGQGAFFNCEPGKTGIFSSIYGGSRKLRWGDVCPTCNGNGYFKCNDCGRTGLINCFYCQGTGTKDGASSAQKVTSVQEIYHLFTTGEFFLSDGESLHFDSISLRDELIQSKPIVFNQTNEIKKVSVHADSKNKAEQACVQTINDILESSSLIGLSLLAYSVNQVATISFAYKDEQYRIFVIGDHAFAQELPSLSFTEALFGRFKKNVR